MTALELIHAFSSDAERASIAQLLSRDPSARTVDRILRDALIRELHRELVNKHRPNNHQRILHFVFRVQKATGAKLLEQGGLPSQNDMMTLLSAVKSSYLLREVAVLQSQTLQPSTGALFTPEARAAVAGMLTAVTRPSTPPPAQSRAPPSPPPEPVPDRNALLVSENASLLARVEDLETQIKALEMRTAEVQEGAEIEIQTIARRRDKALDRAQRAESDVELVLKRVTHLEEDLVAAKNQVMALEDAAKATKPDKHAAVVEKELAASRHRAVADSNRIRELEEQLAALEQRAPCEEPAATSGDASERETRFMARINELEAVVRESSARYTKLMDECGHLVNGKGEIARVQRRTKKT